MSRTKLLGIAAGALIAAVTVGLTSPTGATSDTPYRRWIDNKTFTCENSLGDDGVSISNQDVQLSGLPAGAEFKVHYIVNGVDTTDGPYPVEDATGTRAYGAYWKPGTYPMTLEYRLDTIVYGELVYTSTLTMTCSAYSSAADVHPVNVDVLALPPSGSSTTWPLSITAAALILVGAAATGVGLRRRLS